MVGREALSRTDTLQPQVNGEMTLLLLLLLGWQWGVAENKRKKSIWALTQVMLKGKGRPVISEGGGKWALWISKTLVRGLDSLWLNWRV